MLEIINIVKKYDEKTVLDNINLKLNNGIYGLLRTKRSWKINSYEYYNRKYNTYFSEKLSGIKKILKN